MSGIVCLLNLDGAPIDRDLVDSMIASMAYRGGDGRALWCDGAIALGLQLLRDDVAAAQPARIAALDGRLWAVADASLDARDDLVNALEARACPPPAGATDAELIVRAYEAWGEECVDHLLGDFSFAIWDARTRRLFCARDHLGVRPLYYARVRNALVFSNTLNCVRLHPGVSGSLNDRAIGDFLLFGCNQDVASTTFADIQRLPPGHVLACSERTLGVRRYWILPFERERSRRTQGDCVEEFRAVWQTAVGDRVNAGRVGVLMSGGLDSTSVAVTAHACLSARSRPFDLRIHTLVYDTLPDEERRYAALVSDSLAIPIHYLQADAYSLFERLDEPWCQTPEPCDNPLAAMTADLLRQVASRCRLALSGDGGDPALSGPGAADFATLLRHGDVGTWIRDVAGCLAHGYLPPLGIRGRLRRLVRRATAAPAIPPWIAPAFAARIDARGRFRERIEAESSGNSRRPAACRYLSYPFWSSVFESYDPGYTSIPVRFRHPFFDVRLLKLLNALPPIPWLIEKRILREAMRGVTPEPVRTRPKTPMAAEPVSMLLRQPAARRVTDFKPAPELLEYVDLNKVPKAGMSSEVGACGSDWHALTRPLCLNVWFANALSPRAVGKGKCHGPVQASETA